MRSLPAKPLIGLLLATVVFFALWIVALKPGSSTSGGSPNGVGQYQSAINAARGAAKTSDAANAKLGAPVSTVKSPAPSTTKATTTTKATMTAKAATSTKAATPAKATAAKPAGPSTAAQVKTLQTAVADHNVVAVLFYNPAAADDRAMKQELASVPAHSGHVVKLAIPVSELTKFEMVTAQIPVVTAPTLIVIDSAHQATSYIGFLSQMALNQRVANALAVN